MLCQSVSLPSRSARYEDRPAEHPGRSLPRGACAPGVCPGSSWPAVSSRSWRPPQQRGGAAELSRRELPVLAPCRTVSPLGYRPSRVGLIAPNGQTAHVLVGSAHSALARSGATRTTSTRRERPAAPTPSRRLREPPSTAEAVPVEMLLGRVRPAGDAPGEMSQVREQTRRGRSPRDDPASLAHFACER